MANFPISNVTRRVVYTGSAGVGPYAFSFEIITNTDIAVYKNATLLTLTTNYTVTINANGTGSVTLVSAATGTDNITIVGARAVERTTDFSTGGDLFANTLNSELDSEVILIQQVAESTDRSIKAPVTDPTTINMTLPVKASRAGYVLSFNSSTGNPEVTVSAAAVAAAATDAAAAAASASAASSSASSASSSQSSATSSAAAAAASAASIDLSVITSKTSATGASILPAGTTAQRDASPLAGYIRYNSTNGLFEGYTSGWGSIVRETDTQTLTNKTLTNPAVTNYVETVQALGTVGSTSTLALTNGTVLTATLTASTLCTFTMPTATAGKSFVLLLKQAAATGNGTATFTGVKFGTAGAPTITATAGKMDILTFIADGTNWYGSIAQGYTP
jgi:hypothetical protein